MDDLMKVLENQDKRIDNIWEALEALHNAMRILAAAQGIDIPKIKTMKERIADGKRN